MGKHKCESRIKKNHNRLFYQHIDDWDNWYIELFENFPCDSKELLNKEKAKLFEK
jgi:hypothetical protein